MRVGAIDCGTNSIRLLVADRTDDGLIYLVRRTEIVRLGQGVDVTGKIADEAMERTLLVAREYAQICREHHVEKVRFVATSASRDASNAGDFIEGVKKAFGDYDVAPEVVAGAEEAFLSFTGATGDLTDAVAPYLVVDLGGGSTELVRGESQVEQAISLDMGSVRMTERHFHSDPPSAEEIARACADIDKILDDGQHAVSLEGIGTVIGLAGTITTVTAAALNLPAYDSARIHGAKLTFVDALAACDRILGSTKDELRAMGFMHPGRVDVIAAGALIWRTILERVSQKNPDAALRISETDILDGIALSVK